MRSRSQLRSWLTLGLLVASPAILSACECDRDAEGAPGAAEGSSAEGASEPSAEGSPSEGHEGGAIGRVLAVFDDATVTTRLLVLHRVGDASAQAPEGATELGVAWIAGRERELTVVSREEVSDRTAQLFGPVGVCEARVLGTLTLRGIADGATPSEYAALEVAPCEGASLESVERTHPFGVEGSVEVEQLLSASMEAATEAQAAVVADAERAVGEGEELELHAHVIDDTDVAVVSGWQCYVTRGDAILATYEAGVPAYARLAGRRYVLARDGREIRLLEIADGALRAVAIDGAPNEAAPSDAAPNEAANEAGGDEGEPTP